MPTLSTASRLARFDQKRRRERGCRWIGGVDEAGRGPLAGPVVAACVVLGPGCRLPGLDDSKQLTHEQREALVPRILDCAAGWGVGWASAEEVDRVNILRATHLAAGRAIGLLVQQPEWMVTDFLKLEGQSCPVEAIPQADGRCQAVAAASILAKVARDRIMLTLHAEYPDYGFDGHKGYATPRHWAALRAHGPSTLHRLSFRGVRAEPFFNLESGAPPPRRCLSHGRRRALAGPPAPAPLADWWLEVLTHPPQSLLAEAFLPACDW